MAPGAAGRASWREDTLAARVPERDAVTTTAFTDFKHFYLSTHIIMHTTTTAHTQKEAHFSRARRTHAHTMKIQVIIAVSMARACLCRTCGASLEAPCLATHLSRLCW